MSKIIPLIPKHTVYVEPFAGGASIFWNKPYPKITSKNQYIEVINDLNSDVYNFYKQMRENFDKLNHLIIHSNYSEQLHSEAQSKRPRDDLERAFYFFVNVEQSFANIIDVGWGRDIFLRNSSEIYNKKIKNFINFKNRLDKTNIANSDALKCIKDWDSPQTFFYIDPPYVGTECGHYGGYSEEDYKKLLRLLKLIKGSFILSSYDNPYLKNYPFEKFKIETTMSASGKGKVGGDKFNKTTAKEMGDKKRTEVLIRKINKVVRPEIQKIYDSGGFDCFV